MNNRKRLRIINNRNKTKQQCRLGILVYNFNKKFDEIMVTCDIRNFISELSRVSMALLDATHTLKKDNQNERN